MGQTRHPSLHAFRWASAVVAPDDQRLWHWHDWPLLQPLGVPSPPAPLPKLGEGARGEAPSEQESVRLATNL
jgi:hypothetical protein